MQLGNLLIAACCTLYVAVLLAPTGVYSGIWRLTNGKDAAAWVQAVGSVLAIFVAIAIAAWQNYQTRRDARETEKKRDVVKIEAAYAAIAEAASGASHIYHSCLDQKRPLNAASKVILLDEALQSIKRLPTVDAPHPLVVVNLALAKLQVSQLIPCLSDLDEYSKDHDYTPQQIAFLEGRAVKLLELANSLADILLDGRRPDPVGLNDVRGVE